MIRYLVSDKDQVFIKLRRIEARNTLESSQEL
jgi:hypothetical protein